MDAILSVLLDIENTEFEKIVDVLDHSNVKTIFLIRLKNLQNASKKYF